MSAHSIALLAAEVKVSCCRGAAVPVTAALLQNYSSFSGCSSAEVCIIPEARSSAVTISGGGGDLLGTVAVSRCHATPSIVPPHLPHCHGRQDPHSLFSLLHCCCKLCPFSPTTSKILKQRNHIFKM